VKKAELRTLLQNIDKEAAATITFDEFLDMASPKVCMCVWCAAAASQPASQPAREGMREGGRSGLVVRPSESEALLLLSRVARIGAHALSVIARFSSWLRRAR
jgi:hypothetical protein